MLYFLTMGAIFVNAALAQTTYSCGDEETTYKTLDVATLCLVFPDMDPVQKVLFNPIVDKFEALQIKGLWQKFELKTDENLQIMATSNGVESRPAFFKMNQLVAPILNLQITMDMGKITELTWDNSCYDD